MTNNSYGMLRDSFGTLHGSYGMLRDPPEKSQEEERMKRCYMNPPYDDRT
jgi:hypothetical protein